MVCEAPHTLALPILPALSQTCSRSPIMFHHIDLSFGLTSLERPLHKLSHPWNTLPTDTHKAGFFVCVVICSLERPSSSIQSKVPTWSNSITLAYFNFPCNTHLSLSDYFSYCLISRPFLLQCKLPENGGLVFFPTGCPAFDRVPGLLKVLK